MENGSPVSHMKYAADSKDTNSAFYLPSEMEMSNIRYSRTSTARKHGYVKTEVIHTDTWECNCCSYNSNPLSNTQFNFKNKDRKPTPVTSISYHRSCLWKRGFGVSDYPCWQCREEGVRWRQISQ